MAAPGGGQPGQGQRFGVGHGSERRLLGRRRDRGAAGAEQGDDLLGLGALRGSGAAALVGEQVGLVGPDEEQVAGVGGQAGESALGRVGVGLHGHAGRADVALVDAVDLDVVRHDLPLARGRRPGRHRHGAGEDPVGLVDLLGQRRALAGARGVGRGVGDDDRGEPDDQQHEHALEQGGHASIRPQGRGRARTPRPAPAPPRRRRGRAPGGRRPPPRWGARRPSRTTCRPRRASPGRWACRRRR